jgi:hypothetical protein
MQKFGRNIYNGSEYTIAVKAVLSNLSGLVFVR